MAKLIVFDLETKKLADEVGGWSHIDRMGFAAGVTYDVGADAYERFTEAQADELIQRLIQAEQIIGFNLIRFDYAVLRPYGFQVTDGVRDKSTDLLLDIYQALGFRIGLDNLAEATLKESKSADGLDSVKWFREGKIDQVLDYCEQDVRITYKLWAFGVAQGYVRYSDRRGNGHQVKVNWALPARLPGF
ncbi:MAG: hypothetical protein E4G99_06965 [Anaerolineales bacterium]|nr:MAG: hypothetical protein E4G99_06965 [Anaerolineales bacterium]